MAYAAAAFEEEAVMGWGQPREKLRDALIAHGILSETPDDGNPFGPDPAMLASIGRGDSGTYYAPAAWPPPPTRQTGDPASGDKLPEAPVNAAGR